MKISKSEIDFFNAYVSHEASRPVLQCLYLDLSDSAVYEKTVNSEKVRIGKLVATNGFACAAIEVELSDSDTKSYLIPYSHLVIAKRYLQRSYEKVEVTFDKDKKQVTYETFAAAISVKVDDTNEFPPYQRVIPEGEGEYAVKFGAKLLQSILASCSKVGIDSVTLRFHGSAKPISVETGRDNIVSIFMPYNVTPEQKLGKLQK